MTCRASISSPRPGAYCSSAFTVTSPSRSRSVDQSPSRRCRGAASTRMLITCLPSGASDGSESVGIVASSHGSSAMCPNFTASFARSTWSMLVPITIRPFSRSTSSAPLNDGTSESARFTLAVAPGWRMLDARQTMVGPSSTGSQSASVRLGSAAETTVAGVDRLAVRERDADDAPVARADLGDVGAGADRDAVRLRAGLERGRQRAAPAPRDRALPGRSPVVAGGVHQEHGRRARRPRSRRRVEHAARGERTADRLVLEHLGDQVGHGHRQRADRLAAGLRAQVAERLAQLQPGDRVGDRRGLRVGRRDRVDVREEARDRAHLLVERRDTPRRRARAAASALRRSSRRRPRT